MIMKGFTMIKNDCAQILGDAIALANTPLLERD